MADKAMTPAMVQKRFAVVAGPFTAGTAFNFFNDEGITNYLRVSNPSDKILYFRLGYELSPTVSATIYDGFVAAGQCVEFPLSFRDEELYPTINWVQLFLTASGTPTTVSVCGW